MPDAADIRHLFNELWPAMHASGMYRDQCLANLSVINALFDRHAADHDALVPALDALDGIGVTIATGLIYSCNRETRVPFDRHTMGYALQLRLFRSNVVSGGGYVSACEAVVDYTHQQGLEHGIVGFVREAVDRCQFPLEPA